MSTTIVETWATDISALGPIYPFVGGEVLFWLLGLIFWIGFHILQLRHEEEELAEDAESASHPDTLRKALDSA